LSIFKNLTGKLPHFQILLFCNLSYSKGKCFSAAYRQRFGILRKKRRHGIIA